MRFAARPLSLSRQHDRLPLDLRGVSLPSCRSRRRRLMAAHRLRDASTVRRRKDKPTRSPSRVSAASPFFSAAALFLPIMARMYAAATFKPVLPHSDCIRLHSDTDRQCKNTTVPYKQPCSRKSVSYIPVKFPILDHTRSRQGSGCRLLRWALADYEPGFPADRGKISRFAAEHFFR